MRVLRDRPQRMKSFLLYSLEPPKNAHRPKSIYRSAALGGGEECNRKWNSQTITPLAIDPERIKVEPLQGRLLALLFQRRRKTLRVVL